jgi:hypothetical protein
MEIQLVMQQMLRRGWLPGGPPPDGVVEQIEREFDVTLPADYRDFLKAVGGGEALAPDSFIGLWSTQGVLVLNRRYKFPWNFPGLLAIGNDGFMTYVLDFRGDAPVVASLGLSSSSWEDVVTESDTFAEWLERRLP